MESLDGIKDLPINEEFPELDEPGCNRYTYHKYIFNSLLNKGYVLDNFTRKMREAGEYISQKECRRRSDPGWLPCL